MLPKVIIFDNISLDGRIDGFNIDTELYYQLASEWSLDAVLMSSKTLLKRFHLEKGDINEEMAHKFSQINETDNPQLLVVPDSRGMIRNWNKILENPIFKDILVLCSNLLLKNIWIF